MDRNDVVVALVSVDYVLEFETQLPRANTIRIRYTCITEVLEDLTSFQSQM